MVLMAVLLSRYIRRGIRGRAARSMPTAAVAPVPSVVSLPEVTPSSTSALPVPMVDLAQAAASYPVDWPDSSLRLGKDYTPSSGVPRADFRSSLGDLSGFRTLSSQVRGYMSNISNKLYLADFW